jgi:predicted ATP-dependent endonuclease of OLD family
MESFNIDLKNFQSIAEADLEFTPGINLIVGQSNSGKTAILRSFVTTIKNYKVSLHTEIT